MSIDTLGSGGGDNIIKHPWPLPTKKAPTLTTEGPLERRSYEEDFETRVLVELVGRPASKSTEEIRLLEESFLNAYLSLDSREGITLENVTILEDIDGEDAFAARRSPEDSLNTKAFAYLYLASSKCKACGGNERLFAGEKVDHSLKGLYSPSHSVNHRYLREDKFRRVTAEELCDGCPSKNDFFTLYNATILNLQAEGSLDNVVAVGEDIFEQEAVPCTDEPTDFETIVNVAFEGDPNSEPSSAELKALTSSFVESYNAANALNGEVCDPFFRVANEAEVIGVGEMSAGRTRSLQQGHYKKFKVQGSCHGCPKNTEIYGGDIAGCCTLSSLVHEKASGLMQTDRGQHEQALFRDGHELQAKYCHFLLLFCQQPNTSCTYPRRICGGL